MDLADLAAAHQVEEDRGEDGSLNLLVMSNIIGAMPNCAWVYNHPLGAPDAVTRFIVDGGFAMDMHSPAQVSLDLCESCAAYFRSEVEPNPANRIEEPLVPTANLSRERLPA